MPLIPHASRRSILSWLAVSGIALSLFGSAFDSAAGGEAPGDGSGSGSRAATAGPIAAPTAAVAPMTLLIAVDGLEWDVLLPMLRAHRLPTLEALMERGSYGLLETIEPTESPIIWTTIATGKLPEKHGILGFSKPELTPGEAPRLYSNRDRRTKAFWNIASENGRRVAVVGWWMTYPVEPVNGVMVAQVNTVEQLDVVRGRNVWKGRLVEGVDGQVFPVERQPELLELALFDDAQLEQRLRAIFGEFPHPLSRLGKRLWRNTQWSFRADAGYLAIAKRLILERPLYDLVAVYLGGPDVVGHRFWRYREPERFADPPSAKQIANLGGVMEDYYAYVDREIGNLIEGVAPDTRILVISDHGMSAANLSGQFDADDIPLQVNSGHHTNAEPGVVIAAGAGIRSSLPGTRPAIATLARSDLVTLGGVIDVTPTLLTLMDIAVGEDMEGVAAELLLAPRRNPPPAPVATHDTDAWRDAHRALQGDLPGTDARIEQLRALGYLEQAKPE